MLFQSTTISTYATRINRPGHLCNTRNANQTKESSAKGQVKHYIYYYEEAVADMRAR